MAKNSGLNLPRRLNKNSSVALIAPAFSFDRAAFEKANKFISSDLGLKTVFDKGIFERDLYFSGTTQRRAKEMINHLTNPEIDALFMIRGGYGCAKIYDLVLKTLKKNKRNLRPKILLGYSDFTIFLNGIYQELKWPTFHGPVLVGKPFQEPTDQETRQLEKCLFSTKPIGTISSREMTTLIKGKAKAPIVGGCLSLITSSIGTEYEVNTKGKILFIEEVSEFPYRIDRMLTQILHSGLLDSIKGLIIGQMIKCEDPRGQATVWQAIESAILPFLHKKKIPTMLHFPAGHGSPQLSFPIGVRVQLNCEKKQSSVTFLERATCD
ncbi:MAG: LD-carboxypeptidase [Bacteriovoracia bacterium]